MPPLLDSALELQATMPPGDNSGGMDLPPGVLPPAGKAGGATTPSEALAILRSREQCASDTIFNSMISTTMSADLNDSGNGDIVTGSLFSFVLALGVGLLVVGHRFESASLATSFGLVLWLVTFLVFQVSGIVGRVNGEQAAQDLPCDFALYVAFGACIVIISIVYLLYFVFGIIKPVLDFLTGFTLGAIGMVVLFCYIEAASVTGVGDVTQVGSTVNVENADLGMLDPRNKSLLYAYEGLSLFVAIVCGVIAIFFMPVISKALRCIVGGLCTAVGCSGLYTLSQRQTMPALPYWSIMIGSAVAGFIWQSYGEKPQHTKAEYAPTESSPLKR